MLVLHKNFLSEKGDNKLRAINKIMTQEQIYQIAANFINYFNDNENKMPVAIAYAIQKNKQTFITMAQEIEQNRQLILSRYGSMQEDGNFFIPRESIEKTNKELQTLLKIQEEVKIYILTLEELQEIELTMPQMNALMFMINEEDNETIASI